MNEISKFKKIFQDEFRDLDNTSILVYIPRNNNKDDIINYEIHVFTDYIIRDKFSKLIEFYKRNKPQLFPQDINYRFFFKQSIETNLHSLSLTEYFSHHYQKAEIIKNLYGQEFEFKKREIIHEEFFNQIFTSFELFFYLMKIEKMNLTFKESALHFPQKYIHFLTSMMFITKSHRSKLPTNIFELIEQCNQISPGLKEAFINFKKEPNEVTLNELHEAYDHFYIFSLFAEFCMDNVLPKEELEKYEEIMSTDMHYLLLPFKVDPLEKDYGAIIKNISEQTKNLYSIRLEKIHNFLNFN